jgi:ABC-2 type transport system permease protein
MRGSLWDCLFLMTCFLFFLMCVLTFFGSGAASVVEAMQDPMIYIMPGVLFSGLSWPTFCMNDIGGAISLLLPMTWVGDCLRDILLAGYAPQLYKDSLVLVSAGLVIGAVGVFRIVRRIRKEGAAL